MAAAFVAVMLFTFGSFIHYARKEMSEPRYYRKQCAEYTILDDGSTSCSAWRMVRVDPPENKQ